ncbi:MAG: hypothetical protein H5T69_04185 [Chloroflexi bacterium]|nr:hypothetical protein [Chloroflexota bacterium]
MTNAEQHLWRDAKRLWLEAEDLPQKRPEKAYVICPECHGDAEWSPCATCGGRRRLARDEAAGKR